MEQVPVVDIGVLMQWNEDEGLDTPPPGFSAMMEAIRWAAEEWGFFYVSNHGVSDKQLASFQDQIRAFFHLPKDIKRTIRRTATNSRGYFDDELTKNRVDWKECVDVGGQHEDPEADIVGFDGKRIRMGDDCNQWIKQDINVLPDFRAHVQQHFQSMERMSRRLMMVFAMLMDKEATFFDQYFGVPSVEQNQKREVVNSSFLRLNYYPVAPSPNETMAVHHHTDAGALTVLLQDDNVASLQVFHRETSQWVLIPPRKDTFVINIGDMLQVWSNDHFRAPLHRVLANGSQERISAPFFYNPSYDTTVAPLRARKETNDIEHYSPISWYEFRRQRFAGDYADQGQEVQIDQYGSSS